MELHEQQQFDFLLLTATERYTERLTQRNEGAEKALRKLRENPQSEGVWLDRYVDAIFQDFLLDNVGGACFVLKALARRTVATPPEGKIETMLITMAKQAFGTLLQQKTEEALEQAIMYGGGVFA
jgi:hypothetical protein